MRNHLTNASVTAAKSSAVEEHDHWRVSGSLRHIDVEKILSAFVVNLAHVVDAASHDPLGQLNRPGFAGDSIT